MVYMVEGGRRRHVERFTCGLVGSRHFGRQPLLLLLFLTQRATFWCLVARIHYRFTTSLSTVNDRRATVPSNKAALYNTAESVLLLELLQLLRRRRCLSFFKGTSSHDDSVEK